jgi:hypothetical protein
MIIYVCRPDSTGNYIPVTLNSIPDSEPYYINLVDCQAACDVWNNIQKRNQ